MKAYKLFLIGLLNILVLTGCNGKKENKESLVSSEALISEESISSFSETSNSSMESSLSSISSYTKASLYSYSGVEDQAWAGIYKGYTSNPADGEKPTEESELIIHSDGKGTFICGEYMINVTVTDASKFNAKKSYEREIFFTDDYSSTEWSLLYKDEDDEWAGSVCGFFTARYVFTPFGE